MGESNLVTTILVPQGVEYQAVCRGLSRVQVSTELVLPIPVGPKPLTQYLETLQQTGYFLQETPSFLLMGLCGSLTPAHSVGDIVLYQSCVQRLDGETEELSASSAAGTLTVTKNCDRHLTAKIYELIPQKCTFVKGVASDRVVSSAAQKRHLAQLYEADVVDMEGFAALEFLSELGIAVAMVRVVSDDCYYDIPDLTAAFSPDGVLQPLPLAMGLMRQPIAATRLIRGSLRGLKGLQEVTTLLFGNQGLQI